MCGNPEAVASAYSLYDYDIAADLGGDAALENLTRTRLGAGHPPGHRHGAQPHGHRFALGDRASRLVRLRSTTAPFPSYTFNGPDLSRDPRVGIFLEDHYYDRTDAAVVFKRVDRGSGEVRYIYHGNDGTSMPWNDTAQLNYLNPEVREAVIQTILHVARQLPHHPLRRRHDPGQASTTSGCGIPEPGTGGDIPSRAEHGTDQGRSSTPSCPRSSGARWSTAWPPRAPDTLLLAEAFWLMEGYFVRTLGMHRVYNSAFMNMLKNEENAKYRLSMKNTLEFDPEILKRFVNFMNNPDEETAVAQFGNGDKYFGVCTMMATMPGLPMFGHGQVEGFAEKYGMEYRRPTGRARRRGPGGPPRAARSSRCCTGGTCLPGWSNFLLYDFFRPTAR